eukprot:scaffold50250_cov44-Phaeocystis_antarctica.AAC.2
MAPSVSRLRRMATLQSYAPDDSVIIWEGGRMTRARACTCTAVYTCIYTRCASASAPRRACVRELFCPKEGMHVHVCTYIYASISGARALLPEGGLQAHHGVRLQPHAPRRHRAPPPTLSLALALNRTHLSPDPDPKPKPNPASNPNPHPAPGPDPDPDPDLHPDPDSHPNPSPNPTPTPTPHQASP